MNAVEERPRLADTRAVRVAARELAYNVTEDPKRQEFLAGYLSAAIDDALDRLVPYSLGATLAGSAERGEPASPAARGLSEHEGSRDRAR